MQTDLKVPGDGSGRLPSTSSGNANGSPGPASQTPTQPSPLDSRAPVRVCQGGEGGENAQALPPPRPEVTSHGRSHGAPLAQGVLHGGVLRRPNTDRAAVSLCPGSLEDVLGLPELRRLTRQAPVSPEEGAQASQGHTCMSSLTQEKLPGTAAVPGDALREGSGGVHACSPKHARQMMHRKRKAAQQSGQGSGGKIARHSEAQKVCQFSVWD